MSPKLTLSIDGMGGDAGPAPVLDGMSRLLRERSGLEFLVHGDEKVIGPLLARRVRVKAVTTLCHAPDHVGMAESPSQAVRRRESSMWQTLAAVADGRAAAAVSCGNTGALMAMSVLALRKAPGVGRPAIAVHWPSAHPKGYTTVLDVGADLKAEPHNLAQYAVMGAEYARLSLGVEQPRVGLLNMGTEETKGPAELRDAAQLIEGAAQSFDYVGFVEGSDIGRGATDVVVTDGFTGNVALKAAEGTAWFIRDALKAAYKYSWASRIGYIFALTSLSRLRKRIDPRRVNGGIFLGLNGTVVKSHGGADALGISAAIDLAVRLAEQDFPQLLASQLAKQGLDRNGTSPLGAERRVR
ncbi:MAG: phosphate acyltransferase PlsX [Pseudomonadota bacterium]